MATEGDRLGAVEERTTWIMGSPRSGSSWLLRLLIFPWRLAVSPSGLDRRKFARRGPDVAPINESYIPNHIGLTREVGPDSGPGDLILARRGADPSYFFSDRYRDAWEPALRELILRRFEAQADLAAAERDLRDPLILIKEPNGSHAAELVARLLPRTRIVFLLRDGRDVIDSMLDADSPGGWRTETQGVEPVVSAEQRRELIVREANLWLSRTAAVERACGLLPEASSIRVRYEDLLDDTESELARLDRWLGIDRSASTLAAAARVHRFGSLRSRARTRFKNPPGVRAASPGLWRRNLEPEEQDLVRTLLDAKLREVGYRTDEDTASDGGH